MTAKESCPLITCIAIWTKIKRHVNLNAVVCHLEHKSLFDGPDTTTVFVLFELQFFCFCFLNVSLQTERLHIKYGLLASLDK